jgi:DNA-binding NtrC family response regulator
MEIIPPQPTPILIVDDEEPILRSFSLAVMRAGLPEPALLSDPTRVLDLLRGNNFHLVLLDQMMPRLDGMQLLGRIKAEFPEVECLMITALNDLPSAVKAVRHGAYDYLVKPVNEQKLVSEIKSALERYEQRYARSAHARAVSFGELQHPEAFTRILARDPAMAWVFQQVEAVAPSDYNVLISGETGTGKELLVDVIHALSKRSGGPLVKINMAAASQNLFSDDLFGHVKGAYTGAEASRKGFFEAAHGGTLFLDEVSELDSELQAKLLRVIQERVFYPLGSDKAVAADVRLICASNRDMIQEVKNNSFREDLYYRLNTVTIPVPPLRERGKDILLLARHFLQRHAAKAGKQIKGLAPDLANLLQNHPLPGNVRQLENFIASGVIFEKGALLSAASIPDILETASQQPEAGPGQPGTLAEMEELLIQKTLQQCGGNRTQAAKKLGISLRTLQRKLKKAEETPRQSDQPAAT